MGELISYLASAGWYHRYLKRKSFLSLNEDTDKEHQEEDNQNTRDLARTLIKDTRGGEIILSLAIEGGARQLRNIRKNDNFRLSDHGNWRHTHPSAIETCYGRYPFFIHIFPLIAQIYADRRIETLESLNQGFHEIIMKFLLSEITINDINLFQENNVVYERGKEIARTIRPGISVIDALMMFGPETILGIVAL